MVAIKHRRHNVSEQPRLEVSKLLKAGGFGVVKEWAF
jgi:hypothetical protein